MKKIICLSIVSAALLLSSCSMRQNPMPSADTPAGGDPAVTAPANSTPASSTNQGILSEADAKKVALEKVPGAQESDIRGWKLDRDDGRQEYEGSIFFEKMEYEFEIDATTGEIISWEAESIYD